MTENEMTDNEINEQIEEQAQMLYAQHDPELATQLARNIGTVLCGNKNVNVSVALAIVVAWFASVVKKQEDSALLPAIITTGAILRIALQMVKQPSGCFEDDEVNAPSGQLH